VCLTVDPIMLFVLFGLFSLAQLENIEFYNCLLNFLLSFLPCIKPFSDLSACIK